jgi:SAM-dependent methyltransferase
MPDLAWIIKNKIIYRRRYYDPMYRPEVEAEVKEVIRNSRGNWFIDIGCNTGYYSKLARKRFRRVVSIDPNPKHHAPVQVAISNKSGRAEFYLDSNRGSADSLLQNPHILGKDYQNQDQKIMVETITFDHLGIDADLVKVDVEGAEFEVIEGMNVHKPKKAIIELHDERREEELIQAMLKKGYVMEKLDPYHFLFTLEIEWRKTLDKRRQARMPCSW